MVVKTREKLIEVARQLFVHKGLENTTMNDIANASEKGRRTIYTYFRNKKEIYNAVIEAEADKMTAQLKAIASTGDPTPMRLRNFLPPRTRSANRLYLFINKITVQVRPAAHGKDSPPCPRQRNFNLQQPHCRRNKSRALRCRPLPATEPVFVALRTRYGPCRNRCRRPQLNGYSPACFR